jgi:hypothetical protein
MPASPQIDVGAALGSTPGDYGPPGAGQMPDLGDAMGGLTPAPGEEAAEGDMGAESDVDPEFLSLASDIFPDWGPDDPRYKQLQDLIDSRLNAKEPASE